MDSEKDKGSQSTLKDEKTDISKPSPPRKESSDSDVTAETDIPWSSTAPNDLDFLNSNSGNNPYYDISTCIHEEKRKKTRQSHTGEQLDAPDFQSAAASTIDAETANSGSETITYKNEPSDLSNVNREAEGSCSFQSIHGSPPAANDVPFDYFENVPWSRAKINSVKVQFPNEANSGVGSHMSTKHSFARDLQMESTEMTRSATPCASEKQKAADDQPAFQRNLSVFIKEYSNLKICQTIRMDVDEKQFLAEKETVFLTEKDGINLLVIETYSWLYRNGHLVEGKQFGIISLNSLFIENKVYFHQDFQTRCLIESLTQCLKAVGNNNIIVAPVYQQTKEPSEFPNQDATDDQNQDSNQETAVGQETNTVEFQDRNFVESQPQDSRDFRDRNFVESQLQDSRDFQDRNFVEDRPQDSRDAYGNQMKTEVTESTSCRKINVKSNTNPTQTKVTESTGCRNKNEKSNKNLMKTNNDRSVSLQGNRIQQCTDSTTPYQYEYNSQRSSSDNDKLQERVHSFRIGWNRPQNCQIMAEAGFRFTGENDLVICDVCEVKLYNWEDNDDPWIEHKHHSPNCSYLQNNQWRQNPPLGNSAAAKPECQHEYAFQNTGRLRGPVFHTYGNGFECCENHRQWEEQHCEDVRTIRRLQAANHNHANVNRQNVALKEELERVREKNEELETENAYLKQTSVACVCVVCKEHVDFTGLFILFPCGHGYICSECVKGLKNQRQDETFRCPICRRTVTERKIFLG